MVDLPEYQGPGRRFLVRVDGRVVASHGREQLTDAFIQEIYESGISVDRIEKYERIDPEKIKERRLS